MSVSAVVLPLLLASVASASSVDTFDTNPVLGASQAAGVWYTDRYAPAGFKSSANPNSSLGVAAAGTGANSLEIQISPNDRIGNRPSQFNSTFYSTQGRKLDTPQLGIGATVSAKLYVNPNWLGSTPETARSDLWATGTNSPSPIATGFPIIGFTNFGGAPRFRFWNGAGWTDLATAFAGGWNEVGFKLLSATQATYTFNGVDVGAIAMNPSAELGNVMLQGFNFYGTDPLTAGSTPAAGGTSIFWDDLTFNTQQVIPLPTAAMGGLAVLGLTSLGRRRS